MLRTLVSRAARTGGACGVHVDATRGTAAYRPRAGGLYFFPSEDLIEFRIGLGERFR